MIDPRPDAATRRARRRLLLLIAIFLLPALVAYALYFSGWRPETTGNYGELVQPARPLPEAALQTLDGKVLRLSELRGKWTLLMFGAAECPKPCEATLDKIHRIILAQGKEAERVRAAFVVTDPRARDWLQYAIKDYPGMLVLTGSADAMRMLVPYFTLSRGAPLNDSNRIYVVDPLGNFMMSYPAGADANRMRKDLARLLRVSQIG
ncbi:MAG: SCO family protein [Gammaproteobacteria bacterium]|nr:SCO family protein [Gammaproteobacteria bacterium]